ncbi:uncharacterized protein LOC115634162 [Scaptodrosophila lebanonensis]|uniref:Uncharacterized protein LOC115634162 n=1 Tax=Drosophila lebanonensis TaxID=7225 RepID=A0A6J2UK52_DROLE|nr:uncharacterized protein LOC115634162 [Scaptodrosophila lebanonensis]
MPTMLSTGLLRTTIIEATKSPFGSKTRLQHNEAHRSGESLDSLGNQRKQTKLQQFIYSQRGEQNPEYHHAPRCYVKNFMKYQNDLEKHGQELRVNRIIHSNPRYRWADFRRRMVYGIYDI